MHIFLNIFVFTALAILWLVRSLLVSFYPSLSKRLTGFFVTRLQPAEKIAKVGKYDVLGILGKGSTALIYEGIHREIGRKVAIKMLNHDLAKNDLYRQRFQNEAHIIAQLNHPNIIQVFDIEQMHGTFFMIMERMPGNNLKDLLKRRTQFPPDEVRAIIYQVASALEYAHEKSIFHGDVKPANCVMADNNQVKLMDFGLSQLHKANQSLEIEGSPDYLAPEIILGKTGDAQSDIYSLGAMAFALLTGHSPFQADTINEVLIGHIKKPIPDLSILHPKIPEYLKVLIETALAKHPEQRFRHCSDIVLLLDKRQSKREVSRE